MQLPNAIFDALTRPETVVRYRSLKAKRIFRWFQDHLFVEGPFPIAESFLTALAYKKLFEFSLQKAMRWLTAASISVTFAIGLSRRQLGSSSEQPQKKKSKVNDIFCH